MPTSELLDVAAKVFPRNLVVDPDVAALEHRPKPFHAVRVRLSSDELTRAVVDGLMPAVHSPVGGSFVRVDHGLAVGVQVNEPMERLFVRPLNHFGPDAVRGPVLHSDDRNLGVGCP